MPFKGERLNSPVTKPNLKGMKMCLLELFCHVDDFCQEYMPNWEQQQLQSGQRQRRIRAIFISLIIVPYYIDNTNIV